MSGTRCLVTLKTRAQRACFAVRSTDRRTGDAVSVCRRHVLSLALLDPNDDIPFTIQKRPKAWFPHHTFFFPYLQFRKTTAKLPSSRRNSTRTYPRCPSYSKLTRKMHKHTHVPTVQGSLSSIYFVYHKTNVNAHYTTHTWVPPTPMTQNELGDWARCRKAMAHRLTNPPALNHAAHSTPYSYVKATYPPSPSQATPTKRRFRISRDTDTRGSDNIPQRSANISNTLLRSEQ